MKTRIGRVLSSGLAILLMAACSKSAVEPTGTSSVTAPSGVSPASNAQLRFNEQPITLAIANAVVTSPEQPSYTFEVSTDPSFATTVQRKANIAQGTTGQTSVRLDTLAANTDYYWRARTESGGTVGAFGPTFRFKVGPAISLTAPGIVTPTGGAATGTSSMPTFTFAHAEVTGPAGPLVYRLEVASSPAFNPLLIDVFVNQSPGARTQFVSPIELPAETDIYWRVTGRDNANDISSPTSGNGQFKTTFAIDLNRVTYLRSPNIAGWPRTGFLQVVEQDGGGDGPMCTRFTDPGWPDSPWPYGQPGDDPNFGVFANQWYFAKINGVWYGGAGEWLYRSAPSVCKAGQGTFTIGPDSGFGEPFSSWAPRVGELVGYAITSVARFGVRRTVDQRTQVIVQPWRDTSRGSTFAPTSILQAPGSH